jgi:Zn-finger nucleic acid-binding protein
MNCPHCQSEMRQVAHDEVVASVCIACGGIWLDHADLRQLVAGLDPEEQTTPSQLFSVPELSSSHACPACDGQPPLWEIGLPDVPDLQLDTCRSCAALFVAPDEAEAVVRFLRWQRDEEDGLSQITAAPLLELIEAIVEADGPDGSNRPSWNDL